MALVASLAVAAGIHLAVGFHHDFAGLHGTFFMVAGGIQAVAAAVVARRPTRGFVALAAVGSAVLLATWFIERTPGLPGGEALDPLAVLAAVAELVTVAVAVRLVVRPLAAPGRVPALVALGLVVLIAGAGNGFADDGHGDHHHPAEEQAEVDHHRSAPDAGASEAVTPPAPVFAPTGDDHHHDEDASPHGH